MGLVLIDWVWPNLMDGVLSMCDNRKKNRINRNINI